MKVINTSVNKLPLWALTIGYVGENERTQVRINAKEIFAEYPHASPSLAIKPPSGDIYPVVADMEDDDVIWNISNADLAFAGDGEIQLTFIKNNVVAKTVIGKIHIDRSLLVTGDTPSPVETWADQATAKLAEVDSAIYALENIDAEAETLPEGSEATVDLVDVDDHKHFNFGIPRGDKGEKGDKGDTYELTQEDKVEIARIAEDNFTDTVIALRDETEEFKDQAVTAADRAEQAASESGYMEFEMVNGHLIYRRTSNVDVDFVLRDGHLIVEVA